MTKDEITGHRSLSFSLWTRTNLKDSKDGLVWMDIDGFFVDYKLKRCMVLEWKTNNNDNLPFNEEQELKLLDRIMRTACTKVGYEYWGCYLLVFSGESPDDSPLMTLNGIPIGYLSLIEHLSFDRKFPTPVLFN